MRSGSATQAALHVSEMIAGYLSVRLDGAALKTAIAAYVASVQDFPEWVVERACKSCGKRDNPFPVSAGELHAECERLLQPIRDEEAELRKILQAEVYHEKSAAERERVKAGFQSLLKDLARHGKLTPRSGRHQTDVAAE